MRLCASGLPAVLVIGLRQLALPGYLPALTAGLSQKDDNLKRSKYHRIVAIF